MKLNSVILLFGFLLVSMISCDKGDDAAEQMEDEMEMKDQDSNSDGGASEPDVDDSGDVVLGDAGDFSLEELNGGTFRLSDQKDKVTVLFFFGNSCPSCKAAVNSIESNLVDAYADKDDYQLIGIDVWDGNSNAVSGFKSSTSASFRLLLNGSKVAGDMGTTYDRLLVIDKNGDVVFKGTRGASNDIADVVAVVNEQLNN
ncbi:peroxiredoxin family protein [Saccharicrinis aurantiacus]|uniref:peroxiredoxin family protein n=1 Tax=Saccharicrinis aurantiacus TaxID=1849719 RepID=UPI002490C226|nr:TlpA disulfide reductase family protein [Saccharicrinis aurantiacus]